jgi:DNA primase
MPSWIDFKELRSKLSFEDVLRHYGVEVKKKGEQHTGFCPLPRHQGNRNSPSFSANLDRGIFHCFGCQAKGNVLDFAVLMANESPEDGRALKKVAVDLRAKFFPEDVKENQRKRVGQKPQAQPPVEQLELDAIVNEPLNFELKGLDSRHRYLLDRGFSPETISRFGLGFCSRGYFADRIVIPLRDAAGKLIGYAGRVVDDAAITDENPKYLLPTKREREGRTLDFRKSLFLYNGCSIAAPVDDLIIVEGYPSVWWLAQHGFPNVVATMGAECSDEQAALIIRLVAPSGRIWVMPDGDKAGERFAASAIPRLAENRFVRWVKLAKDCQPTDLEGGALRACLAI